MTEKDIIVGLNNIAAKYGYGKRTEPFTNDEWNTIFRAKGIIKHLTKENQRLREEVAEQKSIADHEHAAQMEWFSIAGDYKAEATALQKRLEKAVELPCIEPMTTWDWDDTTGLGKTNFGKYWKVLYRDEDGEFIAYLGATKEEAEALLAELKGGRE